MYKVNGTKVMLKMALVAGLVCTSMTPTIIRAIEADEQSLFGSPEQAVTALQAAVKADDTNAMRRLFGSARDEITNPRPGPAREKSCAVCQAHG